MEIWKCTKCATYHDGWPKECQNCHSSRYLYRVMDDEERQNVEFEFEISS